MAMHDHARHDAHQRQEAPQESFFVSRTFFVSLGSLAMVVVRLLSEHRAHFLGILPFLFLLACPLLRVFMHGGHGSAIATFGDAYRRYAAQVPAFVPHILSHAGASQA